jgi:hypothetical protein
MTALTITCPKCGAKPEQDCHSPKGERILGGVHMTRVNQARRIEGLIK